MFAVIHGTLKFCLITALKLARVFRLLAESCVIGKLRVRELLLAFWSDTLELYFLQSL